MLEEKIVELTKETVALRKAVEANTLAAGGTAGAAPAAGKATTGKPPKAAAAKPVHSKDEVNTILRKVSADISKPAAREIIQSFGAADLADLLTKPEHFDAAYKAAEDALEPAGDDATSGDDDI